MVHTRPGNADVGQQGVGPYEDGVRIVIVGMWIAFVHEAEQSAKRLLAELERVKRQRVRLVAVGPTALPLDPMVAGPERFLERQRFADALVDAVVRFEAQRAQQPILSSYRVGQPVHHTVHRVQIYDPTVGGVRNRWSNGEG